MTQLIQKILKIYQKPTSSNTLNSLFDPEEKEQARLLIEALRAIGVIKNLSGNSRATISIVDSKVAREIGNLLINVNPDKPKKVLPLIGGADED